LRLCVAGLAKGADEPSCEHLRKLVASQDSRIARFITDTIGSYKSDSQFFPPLLFDALASERDDVAAVAIRWIGKCHGSSRTSEVHKALRTIFERRDEALQFQVCLPLIQEFDDADAWLHLIHETQSKAPLRSAAALSSLADAKHSGREASRELIDKLAEPLASPTLSLRWGATKAIGTHSGQAVIERLVPLLCDREQSVRDEAKRCLLKQSNQALVRTTIAAAGARLTNEHFRKAAREFLE
jgi:hypothetical protein